MNGRVGKYEFTGVVGKWGVESSENPGYLGSQDTYYVGTIKGVGKIYQQTFVDTHTRKQARKQTNRIIGG